MTGIQHTVAAPGIQRQLFLFYFLLSEGGLRMLTPTMSNISNVQSPPAPAVNPFATARRTEGPETLQSLLRQDSYRKRFEQVLGERAGQFIGSIISVGGTMPDVEPRSILASAAIAAALDLPIDKNLGFAWIVPYKRGEKKLAQFQMGYRGYVQLALRTAAYERMNAKPINAEALNGYDSVGEPVIDWNKVDKTKPEVGYAFAFRLVNGFTKTAYWSKQEVEAHAQRYSQAYRGGYETPWKTHFSQMALKTVIANELRRWGILSVQMQMAFHEDQGMHIDVDSEVEFPETTDQIPPAKFEAAAAKGDAKATAAEEKAEAAAGLAPAQTPQAPPAEEATKKGKAKKAEETQAKAPAAPAPTTGQPEPPPTATGTHALPASAPDPAVPAAAATPAQVAGGVDLFYAQNTLLASAYEALSKRDVTEAEVVGIYKRRGLVGKEVEQLVQFSDVALQDLVDRIEMVVSQVRIDRKAAASRK